MKSSSGVILVMDPFRAAGLPKGDSMPDDRFVHIKNAAVRLLAATLSDPILTEAECVMMNILNNDFPENQIDKTEVLRSTLVILEEIASKSLCLSRIASGKRPEVGKA